MDCAYFAARGPYFTATAKSSSSPSLKFWGQSLHHPSKTERKKHIEEAFFNRVGGKANPQTPISYPLQSGVVPRPRFPVCSALAERPSGIADYWAADDLPHSKLQRLVSEFQALVEPLDRVKRLLHYASMLPPFAETDRVQSNRVMGCTAQVWLSARMESNGKMRFSVDSDSEITKGFCSCLIHILDGAFPEEVLQLKTEDLSSLNVGLPGRAHSRVNTWHNVLISMQKEAKAIVAASEGKPPVEPFPSLIVSAEELHAQGSYAEAQVSE